MSRHAHAVMNGMPSSIQHFTSHSALLKRTPNKSDSSNETVSRSCDQVQAALVHCQSMYHTLEELHRTEQQQ